MGNQSSKSNKKIDEVMDLSDLISKREIKDLSEILVFGEPGKKITLELFISMYKNIFPTGDPTKFANYVFNAIDKNKDGAIDFSEFIIAVNILRSTEDETKLQWIFKLCDFDSNGDISKNEIINVFQVLTELYYLQALYEMIGDDCCLDKAKKHANDLFVKCDSDKNDLISLDEFMEEGDLITKLKFETESKLIHEFSAMSLCNLANDIVCRSWIAECSGLDAINNCLTSSDPDVQKNSIETLFKILEVFEHITLFN
ncbi:neuronal calcium sensor 1-like [Octopus sinensis]|uniref:Neuronal calcium sensor 1-like n=1 Tax=Octopus sinensis TaxID=2607531 RepID=A0A6P7TTE7_9MOLL|nr:neuronal calcium sensor 1-like [Octopus sinensis]